MPKGFTIGNTGAGKTLWASLYALLWSKVHPHGQIYANYHINLKNAHFTPLMFLPFETLHECLIIFDDVSNLEEILRFTKVIANRSRKMEMELIFTAQYYTMIPRQLRAIADYKVKTKFIKEKDLLIAYITNRETGLETVLFYDAIKVVKTLNLYDTNEVVDNPTESQIINEITRLSKTKIDVEKNLMIYTGNKAERRSLLKKILKKMKIEDQDDEEEDEEVNDDEFSYLELAILKQQFKYSWEDLTEISRRKKTTIFDNIKREYNRVLKKANALKATL